MLMMSWSAGFDCVNASSWYISLMYLSRKIRRTKRKMYKKMMGLTRLTSREQSTQLGSRSHRRKNLMKKKCHYKLSAFIFVKERVMIF